MRYIDERNMYISILVIALSPFVGSYLGVVHGRFPPERFVVLGRSRCDSCGVTLKVYDLLPLISWFWLRGRCRNCGSRIGPAPVMFEFAALFVALWVALVQPPDQMVPGFVLGSVLLLLTATDITHLVLPDRLTLPLIPAGIAVAAAVRPDQVYDSVIGALAGFCSLYLVACVYQRMRGRAGLGFGDVKLFAAAGAWVGWQELPTVMMIAAASGLAYALWLYGRFGAGRLQAEIPFGPFLAAGLWIVWLHRPDLIPDLQFG